MSKYFCILPRGVYDWHFKKRRFRNKPENINNTSTMDWQEFYLINGEDKLHVGTIIRDGDRDWSCFSSRGHSLGVVRGLNSRHNAANLLLRMGNFEP